MFAAFGGVPRLTASDRRTVLARLSHLLLEAAGVAERDDDER